MSVNEKWDRIQRLFLEAAALSPEDRGPFLDRSCVEDAEVRREIESLLTYDSAPEQHIAEALAGTVQSFFDATSLQPGTRIGEYEIRKLIGSGGMGEVYQARDFRLARDVAIKVLPAFLTNDLERLRRFELEAQAAAALNHPNILAVYQMDVYEGAPYLVSELLEGSTLREVMKRGSLPWRSAIEYGVQIARGLTAAHGKGIVHRDLKPENVFVTKDGHIKILDFGLVKLTGVGRVDPKEPVTEAGLAMGTVGYISPEQMRGKAVDYRTDFFSFGAILFEMLSGERAFQQATAADTMSAILNEDPPEISQLVPGTPAALQRIVRRCLEKNPEQRFQSASDLAFALAALSDSAIPGALGKQPWLRHGRKPVRFASAINKNLLSHRWPLLIVAACAALLILLYQLRPAMPAPQVTRVVQLTKSGGIRREEPLYTDGPRVYYLSNGPVGANWQLRQVLLNGDQDTPAGIVAGQFHIRGLSPDDTEFLAISYMGGQSSVWRLPVTGGSPRRVGNLEADDIAWSHDGTSFAYAKDNQLFLANTDGTSSRLLVKAPEVFTQPDQVRWQATAPEVTAQIDHVRWSPDDRRLRFTLRFAGPGGSLLYPIKQALWEVGVDGRGLHELRFNWPGNAIECCGEWTPDGHYFVFESEREGISNLWVLEEKSDRWRRTKPDPVQLTSGPVNYYQPLPGRNGKTIFAIGVQPFGELVRYDFGRRDFMPFLGGRSFAHLAFSPDGQSLAYVAYPEGTLWRARNDGTEPVQLTFPPLQVGSPRWSADGQRISFHGRQPGQSFKNFVISAEGGNPEPFPSESLPQTSPDWVPGRNALTYSRPYAGENPALSLFDRESGHVEKIPGTDGLFGSLWSPDGRYLLALDASDDRLFLVDLRTSKRTQIAGPAAWPTWSPDSQYVYFVRWGVNWIFRVRVPGGREERVLEVPFHLAPWPFTVARDGSLILLREHGRYDIYSLSLALR
jgi:serine/threonine protein kinase/Tol biopolymer transport system component